MNKISISQAWSYATSFFGDQHPAHAIALIGVGIVAPLLLNIALGGAAVMDPAALAADPSAMLAIGGVALLIGIIGFILQTGSYLASWRLGLAPNSDTVGSALSYGLVAALPVLLVTIAFVLVFGILFGIIFGASVIPMIMAGGTPSPEQAAGMGMMILVALPLVLIFFLWISARLCCMGPVMAQGRSYNPLTALAESWRMTSAAQWKLMAYFVLIGIVMAIIGMVMAMVMGVSTLAGGATAFGVVPLIVGSLISIPISYVYVGVPAGIYRALGGNSASDIFA